METRHAARTLPALDRRELAGLLVAALVAGVGVVLLAAPASNWTQGFLRCGSGLDALGCALVGGMLQLAGLLLAGAGLDLLMLRVFRVRRWFPIGLFAAPMLLLGWGVVEALGGSSKPGIMVALIIAYALSNTLSHAVFNLLRAPLGAALAIAVVLLVVAYAVLPRAAEAIESVRRDRTTAALPFTVYLPRSLPEGYRPYESRPAEAQPGRRAHYEAAYLLPAPGGAENKGLFHLYEWRADGAYRPPADCGSAEAFLSSFAVPCRLIGSMPDGTGIYYANPVGASNQVATYTRLGTTQITLASTLGLVPSPAEIVSILRSLAPR